MKQIARVVGAGLAFLFLAMAAAGGQAPKKTTLRDQMIGSWKLTARVTSQPDGSFITDPKYGENPVGYISYDNAGWMSVQFMKRERPADIETFEGYEAYFGHYTVDEYNKTVTHHIEGHESPKRVGTDFVRGVEINGDELKLIVHTKAPDGRAITNINTFSRIR